MSRGTRLAAAVVGSLLALPAIVVIASPLDLRAALTRNGVRLLAVVADAPGCTQCRREIEAWRALAQHYRDDGLSVVVLTRSATGVANCPATAAAELESVCDVDGRQAAALGLEPGRASLWSWRGEALLRAGDARAADGAIAAQLLALPRVAVHVGNIAANEATALSRDVMRELNLRAKLPVIADPDSRGAPSKHPEACPRGEAPSANARLLVERLAVEGSQRLFLALQSVETACQWLSVSVKWEPTRPGLSVAEGIDKLHAAMRDLSQLRELPGTAGPPRAEAPQVATEPEATQGAVRYRVRLDSRPAGAFVLVDGQPACQATPCNQALTAGRHAVEMRLPWHEPVARQIDITSAQAFLWPLDADDGDIDVRTVPKGLTVLLDGTEAGTSPLHLRVVVGQHTVTALDRCHETAESPVRVTRGRRVAVSLTPPVRPAGLRITATDGEGNDLAAEVVLEGRALGRTPGVFAVGLCDSKLSVVDMRAGKVSGEVTLRERATTWIRAVLGGSDQGLHVVDDAR